MLYGKRKSLSTRQSDSSAGGSDEDSLPSYARARESHKRIRLDDVDIALSSPEPGYGTFESSSLSADPPVSTAHQEPSRGGQSYKLLSAQEAQRCIDEARHDHDNQAPENVPAEDAIIEEITCVNFMCHSHLTIRPGPLINFIIGHNGSGKSAVLTALVLCLGGKAAATNRGGSLKAFIKEGRERAVLTVKIKNTGPGAYMSETYGSTVVIERHFSRTGVTGYRIMSSKGKLISQKKDELNVIIDYFALQLDNPINVLSQDMARQFLASSSASDKYRFFFKGTMLERLNADYNAAALFIDDANSRLNAVMESIDELKVEWDRAIKNKERISGQRKLAQKIKEIQAKRGWATVAVEEDRLREIESKIAGVDQAIEHGIAEAQNADQECNDMLKTISEIVSEYNLLKNGQRLAKEEERTELAAKLASEKDKLKSIMAEERDIRGTVENAKKDMIKTSALIDAETQKLQQRGGGRPAQLAEQITKLVQEVEDLESQRKSLEAQRNEHKDTQKKAEQELDHARGTANMRKEQVHNRQRRIHELQHNGGSGQIRPELKRLLAALDMERRFSETPIGPLWQHITLLDQRWSSLLESFASTNLDAFIVRSQPDQKLFHEICHKVGARPPKVFIKPRESRYDTAAKEPASRLQVQTWKNVLRVSEDSVFNSLVHTLGIEQCVLIHDRRKARTFADQRHPNVSRVLTYHDDQSQYKGKGFVFSPGSSRPVQEWRGNPRMQADIQDQLQHERHELTNEQAELAQATEKVHAIQNIVKTSAVSVKNCERESFTTSDEIRQINRQKHSLEDALESINVTTGSDMNTLQEELTRAKEEHQHSLMAQEAAKEDRSRQDVIARELQLAIHRVEQDLSDIDGTLQRVKMHEGRLRAQQEEKALLRNTTQASIRERESQKQQLEIEAESQQGTVDRDTIDASSLFGARVPLAPGESLESLQRKQEKLQQDLERAQLQQGGSEEELIEAEIKAKVDYTTKKKLVQSNKRMIATLEASLDTRYEQFKQFQTYISLEATTSFHKYLGTRSFGGKLKLNHHEKTLDLEVEPLKSASSTAALKTKSLSGGEKSFSTVCLLLALWDSMSSPIRCLDEFDVFMDSVNRDISMRMMITGARLSLSRQYIFITPQAMANLTLGPDIKISKLSDPERGQTTLTAAL